MSTNFLQFNPTEANQETDPQYLADVTRVGGAAVDQVFPSPTANKLFYQLSMMVVALARFIVAQGYSASDSDLPTLLTNLTNAILAAASGAGLLWETVVYAANMVFTSAACGRTVFEMTLTGNVTSSSLTSSGVKGQIIDFIIHQDATGGRTFAWPSALSAIAGVVDPTANATSVQAFVMDGSSTWHPLGPMTSS
jgi:hypothetical protein